MAERQWTGNEIAVIGFAGRFPGAPDVAAFRELLQRGEEGIRSLEATELEPRPGDAHRVDDPHFVRRAAFLGDVDLFDAEFFRYTPREAQITDPQQRLFIECAHQACEDAGYAPERYPGAVGVFAGASFNSYLLFNLLPGGQDDSTEVLSWLVGNEKDFLATRVAYKLNLRGPAITVQTACSTSLVAVHSACASLLAGECDAALAGGVSVSVPEKSGYLFREGSIQSRDGHCRAFDASADGTVFGNGVGVVMLKRLDDALRDGDCVRGVILGTAINNDGSRKAGFTAPSVTGQSNVIAQALAAAQVSAESVGYVEAHGTGTSIGDPIEVAALTRAFRAHGGGVGYCALSSVKTNVGHLDAAAGVTGLIKALCSLGDRTLFANVGFQRPNPELSLETSPFFVPAKSQTWSAGVTPRRAAVSSFGVGGTNAHAIVEEAPEPAPAARARSRQLLTVSAKTATALDAATERLASELARSPSLDLADAAHTLWCGRSHHPFRRAVVAGSSGEAEQALRATLGRPAHALARDDRPVAFVFPPAEALPLRAGRALYNEVSAFKQAVDACAVLGQRLCGSDLRDSLLAMSGAGAQAIDARCAALARFALQYGLARAFESWGARPAAIIGVGSGEYAAACAANALGLEQALTLVLARAALPAPEATLLVGAAWGDVELLLSGDATLVGEIADGSCLVSGSKAALDSVVGAARVRGVPTEPLLESRTATASVGVTNAPLRAASVPLWLCSNTTPTATELDAKRERASTNRVAPQLARLAGQDNFVYLELGPTRSWRPLAGFELRSALPQASSKDDLAGALEALGALHTSGARLELAELFRDERRQRVALPTYPFERRSYWLTPPSEPKTPAGASAQSTTTQEKKPLEEWFYVPSFQRAAQSGPRPQQEDGICLVLFSHELPEALEASLRAQHSRLVCVCEGSSFRELSQGLFALRPAVRADYQALFAALGEAPLRIVHAFNLEATAEASTFDRAQEIGFFSGLALTQALVAAAPTAPVDIVTLTHGAYDVSGTETLCPEQAALIGLSRVIQQECPQLRTRSIDLDAELCALEPRAIEALAAELSTPAGATNVALRGRARFELSYARLRLPAPSGRGTWLREGGTYLITTNLDYGGRLLIRYLAQSKAARIVVLHDPLDVANAEGQSALNDARALGATLELTPCELGDASAVGAAVAAAHAQHGAIHGVFHAAKHLDPIDLTRLDPAVCEAHFRGKVRGLLALQAALEPLEPDFVLVVSSLASVLGGLGFGAYSAANAAVDAYVNAFRARSRTPWICVNWDVWQHAEERGMGRTLAGFAVTLEEGLETIALLQRGAPSALPAQLVVSSGDLTQRLQQWTEYRGGRNDAEASSRSLRDEIDLAYRREIGLTELDHSKTFYELGGDSLMAIQVTDRLERSLGVHVAPQDLMFNSVEQLVALVEGQRPASEQGS